MTVSVDVCAPDIFPPILLNACGVVLPEGVKYHKYVSVPDPVATTEKVAAAPAKTDFAEGCEVMEGANNTVRTAAFDVAMVADVLVATARKRNPFMAEVTPDT